MTVPVPRQDGPLAQEFAQVRSGVMFDRFNSDGTISSLHTNALAALASIEQRVRDMEGALWHYAAEGNWARDEDGNEVWDGNHDASRIARAALSPVSPAPQPDGATE